MTLWRESAPQLLLFTPHARWNLVFMLSGAWLFLPAIPFVALGPLVELWRSRGRMQAQPKDASPFDTGSAEES
jgi:hypothetical protein